MTGLPNRLSLAQTCLHRCPDCRVLSGRILGRAVPVRPAKPPYASLSP
jgi:hypothetical protein